MIIDDHFRAYVQLAMEARERALRVGDEGHKAEWLKIAQAWDRVAHEYANARRLLAASADGPASQPDEPPSRE